MPTLYNMSTTVQQLFDFVKLNTKLQNFFGQGGIVNQPGLMMAQMTNQLLLSLNEPWHFNREYLNSPPIGNGMFMPTQYGIQDYYHAGASCFCLMNQNLPNPTFATGGVSIDLDNTAVNNGYAGGYTIISQTNGISVNSFTGVVTVQFLQPHPGFQVGQTVFMSGNADPVYNSQFNYTGQVAQGGITTQQTSQWSNGFVITAVPDDYHIQFTATNAMSVIISSNISVTNNVATVTVNNGFQAGYNVTFSGVTGSSNQWLNGLELAVISSNGTSFTVPAVGISNYSQLALVGYACVNSGAPGINNWGYLEDVWVTDFNSLSFPQPVQPWIAVDRLAAGYYPTGDKHPSVCMRQDMNNGILMFRLSEPMGTYPYAVNFEYQARAPKFSTPQDIVQWRDDLIFTFMEVLLWYAFRQAAGTTAAETTMQYNIAQASIMQARIADDREDTGEAIVPDRSLMQL